VVAAVAAIGEPRTRTLLREAVRQDGPALAAAALLSALLLFPLFRAWWSAAGVVGLRQAMQVVLAHGQSWFNPGPDSWWYGALVRRLPGLRTQNGEQQIGVGILTTLAALVGFWRARHRDGIVVLATTALVLVVLTTQLGPWRMTSPWALVSAVLPGANAIRAVSRVGLVVLLAWAVGLALAVDQAGRRSTWAAVGLAALCLLEQGVSFAHFTPADDRARVDGVAAAVSRGCAAFVYTPPPDGWPPWRSHLDAVWATDTARVPTLNGYSGNAPPGWMLEDCFVRGPEDQARIDAAVTDWIRRWHLVGTVCQVTRGHPL